MWRPWPTSERKRRAAASPRAQVATHPRVFSHTPRATRAPGAFTLAGMAELRYLGTKGWTRIASVQPKHGLAWVQRLAEVQGGVVDRAQLLACGLSASSIKRLIHKGWLIPLLPGVYALGHRAVTSRGRLVGALLYAGFESALSHLTAAYLLKIVSDDSVVVHVSARRRRRSIRGVVVHRPKDIDYVVMPDGLPVTNPARTLMDIAPRCSDYELQKALANADFHKLLEPDSLNEVTGRGHPGSARLWKAIKTHMPELAETLSYLEDLMLLLCRRYGIPLPIPNGKVGPHKPDGLWPDAMLIVELDGGANHSSPTQRRIDAERDMHYRSLGYLVLRYTYWQVKRQGRAVAAEITATLAARRAEVQPKAG